MLNLRKLDKEMRDADLDIIGVNSKGEVSWNTEPTADQIAIAENIVANHNPVWWLEERIKAYGTVGSQLDMQYHDATEGTTTWKDHIADVKTTYPKD